MCTLSGCKLVLSLPFCSVLSNFFCFCSSEDLYLRGAVSVCCCYIKTILKLGVFKATTITYTSLIILLSEQEVFLVSFASLRWSFSWMVAEVGLFLSGACQNGWRPGAALQGLWWLGGSRSYQPCQGLVLELSAFLLIVLIKSAPGRALIQGERK